jgi:protein MAK11
MKYVPRSADNNQIDDLLAVSTEDGRVIFYSTTELKEPDEDEESKIPYATSVAQVGGKQAGFPGRIKDFALLSLEEQAQEIRNGFVVVTGNSDGVVRIWNVDGQDLVAPKKKSKDPNKPKDATRQIGNLLSTYETGNRITCLASFIMLPTEDSSSLSDLEDDDSEEGEEESESDDSDDE